MRETIMRPKGVKRGLAFAAVSAVIWRAAQRHIVIQGG